MAPDSRRRGHNQKSKSRTRHAAEREERKEKGTPEKPRAAGTRSPHDSSSPQRKRTPRREVVVETGERRERHRTHKKRPQSAERRRPKADKVAVAERHRSDESASSSGSGGGMLSADALAQLNAFNEKNALRNSTNNRGDRRYREATTVREKEVIIEQEEVKKRRRNHSRDERRRVSGPMAEEGRVHRHRRSGYISPDEIPTRESRPWRMPWASWTRRKRLLVLAILVVILVIIIAVAVVVSKKHSSGSSTTNSNGTPSNSNLKSIKQSDIPAAAQGTYLDPFTWYDTTDFNVTYTNTTFGGLPIMGLNSSWDDTKAAQSSTPPLNQPWQYGQVPIRGVNLGGWLSIEPFITPSLFNTFNAGQGVVDEWTLTSALGPTTAATTLEKHYSQFVTEQDFANIQAAGFDHVRIPYSYWAVTTYEGDPYVPKISWRYLLRGIEYARKYGLRVNLDLHGLPGSQNGWNHSGRQGLIRWLNGTDGDLNAQRSIDVHNQLSTFFAQPRYKDIVTFYGLANEPKMISLDVAKVVNWTSVTADLVHKNGLNATVVFGDGFLGLDKWQGQLQGVPGLVLDAHEYVIFDPKMISLTHDAKVQYACKGWTSQMSISQNTATGYGHTLCGEWSQGDTDCATYLNNVGAGTRWEGTLQSNERSVSVLTPACPAGNTSCSCAQANADPSQYSTAYKQWLLTNAEAQMDSFETSWGWFYWTWKTESATQWDYSAGMKAGILPAKTWQRTYNCSSGNTPSFAGLSEDYR